MPWISSRDTGEGIHGFEHGFRIAQTQLRSDFRSRSSTEFTAFSTGPLEKPEKVYFDSLAARRKRQNLQHF